MANDRYGWLDADAAERLLRGGSVEPGGARNASGGPAGEQAARDAETAARLVALVRSLRRHPLGEQPAAAEQPGEEAAVAAFRAAQAARGAAPDGRSGRWRRPWPAGLGRPVRAGLAVGLLACTLGGVAFAAQTGVLPGPFGGSSPGTATATAVTSRATPDGDAPVGSPDAFRDRPGGGPVGTADGDGPSPSRRADDPAGDRADGSRGERLPSPGASRRALAELCLRYQDGTLAAVDLAVLRRAAGGMEVVDFCAERAADGRAGDGPGGDASDTGGRAPGRHSGTPETTPKDPDGEVTDSPGATTGGTPGGEDGDTVGPGGALGAGPDPDDGRRTPSAGPGRS